mgnify:CR=1 FL=1
MTTRFDVCTIRMATIFSFGSTQNMVPCAPLHRNSPGVPGVTLKLVPTDGKLLSMPFNSSTPVLYWNKDLFEAAGLDPNKPPATMEEMVEYADKLTKVSADGKIEQIGSPSEIYEHPKSTFVANFVGTSNLVSGDVAKRITGIEITFSIRPEKIRIVEQGAKGDGLFKAKVALEFRGHL